MARATLSADQDKIVVETLFREKDLVKQIPGASWNHKQSVWLAPLSWGTCVILRGVFRENLEIGDDLAAWAMEELNTRVTPANNLREAIDAPGSTKLFGYQRAGVEFLKVAKRALLADGLGAGKTRQSIMTAMAHYEAHLNDPNYPSPFPILAVVPNSTKTGWKREAANVWPGLEVQIIKGGAAERRKQLETPAHLYVINWEAVRGHSRLAPYGAIALRRCKECGGEDERISHKACEVHKRELNHIDFGMVIADECFLGHVLISTPDGKRPIESLRVGDVVWGYDHIRERVVESRVTATMHRPAVAIVQGLDCTPNHPYYVLGEGYRRAGDLSDDDRLLKLQDVLGVPEPQTRARQDVLGRMQGSSCGKSADVRVDEKTSKHMGAVYVHGVPRTLRDVCVSGVQGDRARFEESRQNHMLNVVPAPAGLRDADVRLVPTEVSRQSNCRDGSSTASVLRKELQFEAQPELSGSARTFASKHAEATQRSSSYGEIGCVPSKRAQSVQVDDEGRTVAAREAYLATTGVWSTLDTTDALGDGVLEAVSGGYSGIPHQDGGRSAAPELLHPGPGVRGRAIDSGIGRLGAPRTQGVRRAPNATPGVDGLHRHEVLELRDQQRYARVCAESALPAGETQTVHSLTTETGNYFAGDVLVSNCHRSKSPTAKQTRALWAATGNAAYRYGLTGTPIANAPDDLWAIMHWLDPNEFPSRTRYIDRFCDLQYNAFGAPIVTGLRYDTKDEFFRIVNPRLRRMPKELVLSHLPPIVRERRDVEMTPKQAKAYKDMAEKLVTDLDGDILTAASPLTKMTRLIQFSSSYAEIEETVNPDTGKTDTKVRLAEPSSKIDAFMDDLDDFGDDSVVVFAQSRQLIYLLHERLEKHNIPHGLITGMQNEEERQKSIDDFQAGKTKYVLATLGAGGTGLTLTAARIAVYLQRSWSLIENEQSEGRVHRIGSEIHDSIMYIDYVTAESVEEVQHLAVAAKGERLEELLRDKDLLKRALMNQDVTEYLKRDVHDAQHNDGGTEGVA